MIAITIDPSSPIATSITPAFTYALLISNDQTIVVSIPYTYNNSSFHLLSFDITTQPSTVDQGKTSITAVRRSM